MTVVSSPPVSESPLPVRGLAAAYVIEYGPPGSPVTVAAPSGALADALTKVFFVAGPDQVDHLARQWNVDVMWVDKQGNRGITPGLRQI